MSRDFRLRLLVLLVAAALAGSCTLISPGPAESPVVTGTPVVIMGTENPVIPAASPTVSLTPSPGPRTEGTAPVIIPEGDPSPTVTAVFLPRALPDARIKVFQPGPASFVTSPFRVVGRTSSTWMNRVVLDLVGENGRLISRTITYLNAIPGNAGPFAAEVSFEIESISEQARLEVYTHSRRDGQVVQMGSVQLFLVTEGRQLIHAALDGPEKLAVFSPRTEAVVEGGVVEVSGAGWVDQPVPLMVELRDRLGDSIASTQVEMNSPGPGQVGVFTVQLEYELDISQPGRIVVYEPGTDIPGMIHLSGVDVWIKP